MVARDKSANLGRNTISEQPGGWAQSYVDHRALVAYGRTRTAGKRAGAEAQVGPQFLRSPLVSEVPQVTNPHFFIGATTAGAPVCPDPTSPRSHSPLQVFLSFMLSFFLILVWCQHFLASTASTQRLTVSKAEKTQRVREAGQAAKTAIVRYCHRHS